MKKVSFGYRPAIFSDTTLLLTEKYYFFNDASASVRDPAESPTIKLRLGTRVSALPTSIHVH